MSRQNWSSDGWMSGNDGNKW